MSLSIRNQIPGTVTSVTEGGAMAIVKVHSEAGPELTAAVTVDAVKDLGITTGSHVRALVESTEVALANIASPSTEPGQVRMPVSGLSMRNQLPGTVTEVAADDAMASVKVSIHGTELTSAITADSAAALSLHAGSKVVALFKSTEVALETA